MDAEEFLQSKLDAKRGKITPPVDDPEPYIDHYKTPLILCLVIMAFVVIRMFFDNRADFYGTFFVALFGICTLIIIYLVYRYQTQSIARTKWRLRYNLPLVKKGEIADFWYRRMRLDPSKIEDKVPFPKKKSPLDKPLKPFDEGYGSNIF